MWLHNDPEEEKIWGGRKFPLFHRENRSDQERTSVFPLSPLSSSPMSVLCAPSSYKEIRDCVSSRINTFIYTLAHSHSPTQVWISRALQDYSKLISYIQYDLSVPGPHLLISSLYFLWVIPPPNYFPPFYNKTLVRVVYSHCFYFSSSFLINALQSSYLSNIKAFVRVINKPLLCQI